MKIQTFNANIGFEKSYLDYLDSVEPIGTILLELLKDPWLANPQKVKQREAAIPSIFDGYI